MTVSFGMPAGAFDFSGLRLQTQPVRSRTRVRNVVELGRRTGAWTSHITDTFTTAVFGHVLLLFGRAGAIVSKEEQHKDGCLAMQYYILQQSATHLHVHKHIHTLHAHIHTHTRTHI